MNVPHCGRENKSSSIFILVINQLMHKIFFYIKFISCLYMFRVPRAHHQEVKIALHSFWYHQTYRWPSRAQVKRGLVVCDDTRGCVMQF